MPGTPSKRSRLQHLALEGVVIVGSILLAFALQAWWDDRAIRQEVVEDLVNVDRELVDNAARVRYQVDFMRRIVTAADTVVRLMGARAGEIVLVDTLAWLGIDGPSLTLNASFGAIDAMMSSGRLASVESPLLRSSLAGLRSRIEDAAEEQTIAQGMKWNQLKPRLAPLIDVGATGRVAVASSSSASRSSPIRLQSCGTVRLPYSPAIRSFAEWRGQLYRVSLAEMERLPPVFEVVRSLIREEIHADPG